MFCTAINPLLNVPLANLILVVMCNSTHEISKDPKGFKILSAKPLLPLVMGKESKPDDSGFKQFAYLPRGRIFFRARIYDELYTDLPVKSAEDIDY